MFQKKSLPLISFILFKDILLYLVIALGLTLLAEIILPGFVASKIRFFDLIILISGVVFALAYLQQKFPEIQKLQKTKEASHFSQISLAIFGLLALLVFLSATYKYTVLEIIILLIGTIGLAFYLYKVLFFTK